jgi:protein-disulfide isomerase
VIADRPVRAVIVAVLAVVVLSFVGVVALTGGSDGSGGSRPTPRRASSPPPAAPTPLALLPYTDGAESAPLHLVEYGDYRCPSCIEMAVSDGVNRVLDRWIRSGRLRFTWRHDAFLGPGSVLAAQAAHAAALQNHFFPVHFALFRASANGVLPTTPEGLTKLARAADIPDARRFERDLTSPSTRRFVRRSEALATRRKVPYVPSFASNGVLQKGDVSSGRRLERRLRKLYRRIDPGASPVPAGPPDADPGAIADAGDAGSGSTVALALVP